MGAHQGSVDPIHLQSCFEALTFRFNRRTSSSRGLVVRRLIEQGVVAGLLTAAELTSVRVEPEPREEELTDYPPSTEKQYGGMTRNCCAGWIPCERYVAD